MINLFFFQTNLAFPYLKGVREKVEPHLIKFSEQAMNNSAPVIRPLWMLDPHDSVNQVIDDEFLIGDKVKHFFPPQLLNGRSYSLPLALNVAFTIIKS